MANKVFSRPNVSRTSPRNAFDRSYVMNYDFSAGELHCVLCKPCIAGTKGKINRQVFTRSNEVNTAAFASLSQNFQFYKVPIRLLWSYWNDFKLQINDLNSSSLVALTTGQVTPNLTLPVGVPSVDISKYFVNASVLHDVGFEDGSAVITNSSVGSVNHQVRILEELGYSIFADPNGLFSGQGSQVVSLLPMAAYQKVYYDHFRNTAYESNDPYAYNLDWFGTTKTIMDLTADLDVSVFKRLSRMRYVNYRNDYFKNIYPALNYVVSAPNGLNWSVPSSVITGNFASGFGSSATIVGGGFAGIAGPNATNTQNYQISAQTIRAAFALDKLMRASSYAPKHVKDQFEARFGIKISDKVSNESEYLGSFSNDIVIGEVTSTANTSNGQSGDSLGAIGGKGIGSDRFGRDIDFYCDEDCFIIGVSYVLPRTSYDMNGIDGYNTKLNSNDFFQPEFQDLGLEPLYRKEYSFSNDVSGQGSNNAIIGYRPRNEVYKVSFDKNLGSFKKNYVLVSTDDQEATVLNVHSGWLSPFVVHSEASMGSTSYWWFKCLPYHLDDIFVQSYDPLAPETNQFFSNLIIKFVTNQDMSVHGQPHM